MVTRALVVVSLLAIAAPAAAQPSLTPSAEWQPAPAAPPVLRRLHVAAGVGLRFTGLDIHDDAGEMQLLDYGWVDARSPAMSAFSGEVAYLLAPIIDVGLAVSTAQGEVAAGLDVDDRVGVRTTSVAVVAKVHYALQRPFIPEPRFDVGVARRSIEVHGVTDADSVPFVRAGMDWRLGTRRAGVQVSAGYMLTGRASSGRLDPAVGGLDVGLAPYLRF